MDMVTGAGFEELEHTADWSLRIWGGTMAELLTAAARGMLALMVVETPRSTGTIRPIDMRAEDRESLLVAWLEDLLFQLETRHVVPVELALEAGDDWLRGSLVEAPCPAPQKAIKSVTFHNLEVNEFAEGLEAQLVFDV
jgi:SHS2 domain-containing protein